MLANLPRLQDVMKREGLDAVIATCPENVTYLSGFWAMSQWVRRGPQAYVLQPKGGIEPCIIANSGILDLVPDQDVWVKEIRRYGYFQVDIDPSAGLDAADQTQRQLFSSQAYKGPVEALVAALEDKGLQIVGAKLMKISPELAATHYQAHKARPFYASLVRFMTSAPVLVLAVRGNNAIEVSRKLMGATFGSKAEAGTIRGDFGVSNAFNLIHGSDSPEAATHELGLFFQPGEVLDYQRAIDAWVYDMSGGKPE